MFDRTIGKIIRSIRIVECIILLSLVSYRIAVIEDCLAVSICIRNRFLVSVRMCFIANLLHINIIIYQSNKQEN